MNERMKALAVEADFMLCEDGHFYSEGQSQKITDGLQKFAELIVRECAQAFEAEVDTWKEMVPYQGSMKRKGTQAIKKHFGVEEK